MEIRGEDLGMMKYTGLQHAELRSRDRSRTWTGNYSLKMRYGEGSVVSVAPSRLAVPVRRSKNLLDKRSRISHAIHTPEHHVFLW